MKISGGIISVLFVPDAKKSTAVSFVRNNTKNVFCNACYDVTYPPPCTRCGQAVRVGVVNYCGTKWHSACFRCSSCCMVFNSTNAAHELMGSVYCTSCFHKRSEPMPQITSPTGENKSIQCRACSQRITSEFFVHAQ